MLHNIANKFLSFTKTSESNHLVYQLIDRIEKEDDLPFQYEAIKALKRAKRRHDIGLITVLLSSFGVGLCINALPVSLLAKICLAIVGGGVVGVAGSKITNELNVRDLNAVLNGQTVTINLS